jgi:ABC-2 type transport system ATP-binding protein
MVIETQSLHKVFGAKAAVADLTLSVPQGEIFGFLGPNGAGKSTSVKMLLGLVRPSGGSARVLGRPPGDRTTMARVGFLPEHFRFHPWLQATELLDLHGQLQEMPADRRRQRVGETLEMVGLSENAHRPISGFSKGMLQRLGLAQALLNDPELVFLDEPTSALDPFGRILVRSIIHQLRQQGKTVFLNSHLLGEVEATCDRVAFIREGRVLRTIVLSDLAADRLHVELQVDTAPPELLQALEQLTGRPVVQEEPRAHGLARVAPVVCGLDVAEEAQLPQIVACVLAHGAQLFALAPRRVSLEQLFLEVIGTQDSGQ